MLSHADAKDCFDGNPDGAGYAFVDGEGKVQTRKGFLTFPDFWAAYYKSFTEFGQDSPFLIHFRIATNGVVGYKNCHPYDIEIGKSAVIHNGVLWQGSTSDPISDTQELVDLCRDQFKDEAFVESRKASIGNIITKGNKLAFLFDTKKTIIVNEDQGEWNTTHGIWFSNMWWSYDSGYGYGRTRRGKTVSTPATTVDYSNESSLNWVN